MTDINTTGLPPGVTPEMAAIPDSQVREGSIPPPAPSNGVPPVEKKVDETKPDAAPVNEDPVKEEPTNFEYETYNNEVADSAVALLKEAGITAAESDAIFSAAVKSGDWSKVDRAKLEEKLGKEKATLVVNAVKEYTEGLRSENAAVVQAVDAVFEGEQNRTRVWAWAEAKKNADPEFAQRVAAFNAMFDSGKVQAELASKELRRLYESDPNNSSLVVTKLNGDSAPAGLEYISRRDYIEQLSKANKTGDKNAIQQLDARRTASIKQERARQ